MCWLLNTDSLALPEFLFLQNEYVYKQCLQMTFTASISDVIDPFPILFKIPFPVDIHGKKRKDFLRVILMAGIIFRTDVLKLFLL